MDNWSSSIVRFVSGTMVIGLDVSKLVTGGGNIVPKSSSHIESRPSFVVSRVESGKGSGTAGSEDSLG